ncbi:hypothetical protein AXF42_Ash005852 [Apostasia shenzhenica]|uniref:Uncharacterized protein n=1 Tax=Apostasia shenzhenica TaxID=1088818 RepID=A0A2I0BCJ8_9ASPA|nr:hypothetical protein AXF42_Ash005852 [Apostasia shenzhenica]
MESMYACKCLSTNPQANSIADEYQADPLRLALGIPVHIKNQRVTFEGCRGKCLHYQFDYKVCKDLGLYHLSSG